MPRTARLVVALLALACLGSFGAALAVRGRQPKPPVIASVPAFSLTDQAGRPATLETFRGQPWVADFIFTSCGSICPVMTAQMARLRGELPAGTRLASFTVDPATDTPARLAEFAARHKAGPEWTFMTGGQEALFRLAQDGFKLPVAVNAAGVAETEGPFLHSQRFVLVDGQARIRGFYDSSDPAELQRLVREAHAVAGD
jgi:protein SCO1/2